jgi:hypothetical protein
MRICHRSVSTTWIVFRVCATRSSPAMTRLANFKLSFVRERGRLCDPVFCSDKVAWFFEIATSHERRSDPLPQGNGSRHRQGFFTGQGEEDTPRAALPHLVKTPRRVERLECRAKQRSHAPWTTGAIITVEWHAQPIHVRRIGLRQRRRDRIRGPHNDDDSTKGHNSTVGDCIASAFSGPQQEGSEMSQLDFL